MTNPSDKKKLECEPKPDENKETKCPSSKKEATNAKPNEIRTIMDNNSTTIYDDEDINAPISKNKNNKRQAHTPLSREDSGNTPTTSPSSSSTAESGTRSSPTIDLSTTKSTTPSTSAKEYATNLMAVHETSIPIILNEGKHIHKYCNLLFVYLEIDLKFKGPIEIS